MIKTYKATYNNPPNFQTILDDFKDETNHIGKDVVSVFILPREIEINYETK